MLRLWVWTELDMVWDQVELEELDSSNTDPNDINYALCKFCEGTNANSINIQDIADSIDDGGEYAKLNDEDEFGYNSWRVASSSMTGPILTIETRGDRNHLAIIIVNYEDQ